MSATNITTANSNAYVVPLTPSNQEFDISLSGVSYHFRVKWNSFSNAWILYIEDSKQNPILSGLPLVTGCDLLEQYGYLNIGGALIVQSTNDASLVPDYNSLGSTGNLFYIIPKA